MGQTLDEVIESEGTGTFDQFKDRKTTYHEGLYSTKYNAASITDEQKRIAARVEREILTAESSNRHM